MYKYALINSENTVVNIVLWDGETEWTPPFNLKAIRSDVASIGDFYDQYEKTFTKPIIIEGE